MTALDVLARPWRPVAQAAGRSRRRVRDWWESRIARSDTLALTQRNIYILPTRAGLMFAITLVVLLVASINYQLNLGYVMTFLLAGSGVVSMHLTHNTLRGLTLHLRPVPPAFALQAAPIDIVLTSTDSPRYGIGLRMLEAPTAAFTWVDVPDGGQTVARVSFVPPRRGYHQVPTLIVETRFPLGMFRAWALFRPTSNLLAYPALESPPANLPPLHAVGVASAQARRTQSGETDGVRAYRAGDPLKLVVWKKLARSGELVSRDMSSGAQQQLWLDYQHCGARTGEERLSRLATWVVAADQAHADFGLRLPGRELPLNQGDAHRHACLEALALWN